jgi:fibronectin type 3 domain-containing protein
MRISRKFSLTTLALLVFLASFRHHSALIGKEENPPDPEAVAQKANLRAGLLSDSGELELAIPIAPSLGEDSPPLRFDLSPELPLPYPQGDQASSVGFVLGYLFKSYSENLKKGGIIRLSKISVSNPINHPIFFSPSFVYNSLNEGKDQGGSLLQGLILLATKGIQTWEEMPYDPASFRKQPTPNLTKSLGYRISDFRRIPPTDLTRIKSYISEKNPLPASLLFFDSYRNHSSGQILGKDSTKLGPFIGLQAVALVGYDDSKKAFKFWNSWGPDWGDSGYGWISYEQFLKTAEAVYWIFDPNKFETPVRSIDFFPQEISASRGNYKDKVRVSWSGVRTAIGYEIFRKRTTESKFQMIGLSLAPEFEDKGIQIDTAYHYTVSAVFEDDTSRPSPDWGEGFAASKILPLNNSQITGLSCSQGNFSDKISVRWDPIPGAVGYHLYKYNRYSKEFRILAKTTIPEYVDKKAERNGNIEFYRVSVAGNFANSTLSPARFGYTSSRSLTIAPPESISASKGEYVDRITLSWSEVSGAVDYKVYRFSESEKVWDEIAITNGNMYEDIGPKSSKNYYSISSLNRHGTWSRASSPVLGFIASSQERNLSRIAIAKPQFSVLKDKSGKEEGLEIRWVPPGESITEFTVLQREPGKSPSRIGVTKETALKVNLPKPGQFYLYTITGIPKAGGPFLKSPEAAFGFIPPSQAEDTIRVRSFGVDSKLEKFKGPWTSMYWDGKASVSQVQLIIDATDETNQTCQIRLNQKVIYSGDYIQEERILDPQGSFLLDFSEKTDSIFLEIRDKKLFRETTSLSFVRE